MSYECTGLMDMKPRKWAGYIKIQSLEHPYECSVSARGSFFQIILGRFGHGTYICVPNYDIGCDLACLTDSFWNIERLCSTGLSTVDAISIADALVVISEYIDL